MIGLMRNGVLLAEASPLKLLTDYNCEALEEVFLLLSHEQSVVSVDNDEPYPKKVLIKPSIEYYGLWNLERMKAQIYKNTCWAKRNIPILLFMLALPAVLMFLFCTVYSDTLHGVTIAVVTKEVLPDSCLSPAEPAKIPPHCKPQSRHNDCSHLTLFARILLFMLALPAVLMFLFCTVYSDTLHGVTIAVVTKEVLPDSCLSPTEPAKIPPHCKPKSRLSCKYLRLIKDKSYTIKEYKDFDSAYQSVVRGESRAFLHFAETYSWSVIRRLSEFVITPDRYVNSSMVDVYIDRAEMTIGFKIDQDLREGFLELVEFVFKDCGWNLRSSEQIVQFEKPIFGERLPKFTDSAFPGFLIPLVFYFTSYFSATSLASEKMSGFLGRCAISGVRQPELVFAHAVVQLLMVTGQNLMLFFIAYGVYDLPLHGSWALIILIISLVELQGMFYGFSIGTAFDEERSVTYSSTGTVVFLFLSSGMFWPIEGAHWLIFKVLENSPIVMSVESYRAVSIRGWGIGHGYIVRSIVANIAFVLVILGLFILISKVKK